MVVGVCLREGKDIPSKDVMQCGKYIIVPLNKKTGDGKQQKGLEQLLGAEREGK